MMALTANHTVVGDRAVLLPDAKEEPTTHSDLHTSTSPHPPTPMHVHLLGPDDVRWHRDVGRHGPHPPSLCLSLPDQVMGPTTHMDAVGDHRAIGTVFPDTEVVQVVGECRPMVVNVSKVDDHRGDRGVPAD